MTISISGGAVSWASGSSAASSSGTSAEQAYRAALKALARAQGQLSLDAASGAGEQSLQGDETAVQLAAARTTPAAATQAVVGLSVVLDVDS